MNVVFRESERGAEKHTHIHSHETSHVAKPEIPDLALPYHKTPMDKNRTICSQKTLARVCKRKIFKGPYGGRASINSITKTGELLTETVALLAKPGASLCFQRQGAQMTRHRSARETLK